MQKQKAPKGRSGQYCCSDKASLRPSQTRPNIPAIQNKSSAAHEKWSHWPSISCLQAAMWARGSSISSQSSYSLTSSPLNILRMQQSSMRQQQRSVSLGLLGARWWSRWTRRNSLMRAAQHLRWQLVRPSISRICSSFRRYAFPSSQLFFSSFLLSSMFALMFSNSPYSSPSSRSVSSSQAVMLWQSWVKALAVRVSWACRVRYRNWCAMQYAQILWVCRSYLSIDLSEQRSFDFIRYCPMSSMRSMQQISSSSGPGQNSEGSFCWADRGWESGRGGGGVGCWGRGGGGLAAAGSDFLGSGWAGFFSFSTFSTFWMTPPLPMVISSIYSSSQSSFLWNFALFRCCCLGWTAGGALTAGVGFFSTFLYLSCSKQLAVSTFSTLLSWT